MLSLSPSPSPSYLRQAIQAQEPQKALELLQGPDSWPDIEDGNTNLQEAIKWCPMNPELIIALIAGRDLKVLDCKDSYDNTPMITAAAFANVLAIDLLAKAGVRVDVHDNQKKSPLCLVVTDSLLRVSGMYENRHEPEAQILQAAQTLVRHGARADGYNIADNQPLLKSYIKSWDPTQGDPNLIKFLVAEGAEPLSLAEVSKLTSKNETIIHAAIEEGLQERQIAVSQGLDAILPASIAALIGAYILVR